MVSGWCGGRHWGGRMPPRQYLQREDLWKAVYNVGRDKKPTTRLVHVLGGRGVVPLLPFPSRAPPDVDTLSPRWPANTTACSEKLQQHSYY